MGKLLINGEWYHGLASTSYYEAEYEALVEEHAPEIFPDYVLVPFKVPVSSEYGERKPDFALIERQYRCWWVVEVELGHHPLRHVTDQVAVFASASYGDSEAVSLKKQADSLNLESLMQMMKGASPEVLVIANMPKPDWLSDLSRWGASLAVVEVFRSDRNHHVLRVNGAYPSVATDVLSTCRLDPSMPRLVLLDSPANVPSTANGRLLVDFAGTLTEWERIQIKDRVWLSPVRTNPLPAGIKFALVRDESGRLALKRY